MSQEFDKVSYWRERSMKRFETYLFDSRVMFKELRNNYIHIEGQISPEWVATTNNIDQALTEFQNVLITMGKPKKEASERKKEDTKVNKVSEEVTGKTEEPSAGR